MKIEDLNNKVTGNYYFDKSGKMYIEIKRVTTGRNYLLPMVMFKYISEEKICG